MITPASALPPHPAARARALAAVAQRMQAQPYTGQNPIVELQAMSTVFRLFAKADDTTVQEVQAMWYKIAANDPLALAVSANNTSGDRNAVTSITAGRQKAVNAKAKYPPGALGQAKKQLNTQADATLGSATLVTGRSHAEQNLLAWIAPKLTADSVFYIAGTKDPCTQCQPRLSGYQNRLVLLGYDNMFTYHDGGDNQDVLANDVRDQVDPQMLDVP